MSDPRILRWQDQMGTVAERWKAQYYNGGAWSRTISGSAEATYNKLRELDAGATHADVRRIIGNDGWVMPWCNGCGAHALVAIQLGDEPDYESSTVTLCLACFDEAVELRKSIAASDPHATDSGKLPTRDP